MNLHEKVNLIKSKKDLAEFVADLRQDLLMNPGDWENHTLDRYLSAMSDWISEMDNYYVNTGMPQAETPTWKTLADILYAAKIYE